jgi:hypothetical protein
LKGTGDGDCRQSLTNKEIFPRDLGIGKGRDP